MIETNTRIKHISTSRYITNEGQMAKEATYMESKSQEKTDGSNSAELNT